MKKVPYPSGYGTFFLSIGLDWRKNDKIESEYGIWGITGYLFAKRWINFKPWNSIFANLETVI